MVTSAECDCSKSRRVADQHPPGKANLDRLAALAMGALKARWQRRGIICDDEVAGAEQGGECSARQMLHPATGVDGEEFGGSPVGTLGSNHDCTATAGAAWLGNAASSASTISAAASSGRRKVVGSLSGTASACSGVSMSPGSGARKAMPSAFASSAQIAVRWWRAALLEPYAPQPE